MPYVAKHGHFKSVLNNSLKFVTSLLISCIFLGKSKEERNKLLSIPFLKLKSSHYLTPKRHKMLFLTELTSTFQRQLYPSS